MADRELGHVIPLLAQGDEVVVDSRLVFARVVEVELFRLDVVFVQFFLLEFGDFFEEALFFFHRHAPYYDDAVFEEEDFGDVDGGVEVGFYGAFRGRDGVDRVARSAGLEGGVAGFGLHFCL